MEVPREKRNRGMRERKIVRQQQEICAYSSAPAASVRRGNGQLSNVAIARMFGLAPLGVGLALPNRRGVLVCLGAWH
ncbi:hypothetical protein BH23GEM6_BH23GEM6_00920 [soil metagenome]